MNHDDEYWAWVIEQQAQHEAFLATDKYDYFPPEDEPERIAECLCCPGNIDIGGKIMRRVLGRAQRLTPYATLQKRLYEEYLSTEIRLYSGLPG